MQDLRIDVRKRAAAAGANAHAIVSRSERDIRLEHEDRRIGSANLPVLPVRVVAAPSSEPGVRRANTPDTYAWLAGESGWVGRGDSVLLVTTDIYRPFQHADAIRMLTLPHGIDVDLVGVQPGGVRHERLAQTFEAHNYLQENPARRSARCGCCCGRPDKTSTRPTRARGLDQGPGSEVRPSITCETRVSSRRR